MNDLLLTGVPGWLTTALLDDLFRTPEPQIGSIVAVVHPASAAAVPSLLSRHPNLGSCTPLDLGVAALPPSAVERVGLVLHSAAVIHVRRTSDWYRINTTGTINLATAAKRAGVRRFVFISSNAAGGASKSPDVLISESDTPHPKSHYGRSKLLAEQALLQLHAPGVFDVVILRPSMFYGPPVPDRHVDVYRRILTGRMPVVGGGGYARSITYIDSLVQASRLALTVPAAAGETYYVVDDAVYTTKRIVEAMALALGCPLRALPIPALFSSMAYAADRLLGAAGLYQQELHLLGEANWHVGISCGKAKRQLGYSPLVQLEEGMRRAVAWCREQGKL